MSPPPLQPRTNHFSSDLTIVTISFSSIVFFVGKQGGVLERLVLVGGLLHLDSTVEQIAWHRSTGFGGGGYVGV